MSRYTNPDGGNYDDLSVELRHRTQARGVVVMVFDGVRGTGFSVTAEFEIIETLPDMLEQMAADIRRERLQS